MTSELVERLRATYPASGLSANTQLLREKAADEIERLTAQLAEARQAERVAVVAWLDDTLFGDEDLDYASMVFARRIKEREHLK